MYACIHMDTYVCVCMSMFTCHVYTYTYIFVCVYGCFYVCLYIKIGVTVQTSDLLYNSEYSWYKFKYASHRSLAPSFSPHTYIYIYMHIYIYV